MVLGQHMRMHRVQRRIDMSGKSAEQQARDLLEQYGLEDAQSMTAGDLVELANLIADANAYRRRAALCICVPDDHDILNGGMRDDCPTHGDPAILNRNNPS